MHPREDRLTSLRALSDSEHPLVTRDRRAVWHPYAPPSASPLFAVASARGITLQLADGRELVDGMSSWWSAIHGYRHPHIEAAVRTQLERLPHVMFGGLTHEPAVSLCERLLALAPPGLERVFLCDSGWSVETRSSSRCNIDRARRAAPLAPAARRLSRRHAGAMAVDPITGMHGPLGPSWCI
jgi:adenosylmethionine-8-amino-7-oxononanoate aminotransferase